jgi:hypothetical protein
VTSACLILTLKKETGDSLAVDSDILIGITPGFAEMSNGEFVAFAASPVRAARRDAMP